MTYNLEQMEYLFSVKNVGTFFFYIFHYKFENRGSKKKINI
jgi:hypothetical protein